jgi:MYXO-CTERM domain-containing protein
MHRTLAPRDENDFFNWHGEGSFPNFSATGGPITFGFWRGNNEGTYSMTTGIDNWSMTIHTVPEPAGLGLAALSAIALIRRRVR